MNNNEQTPSLGIGGMLLVAFIVLKLCDVIDWSWWWVLSPVWISIGLVVVVRLIELMEDLFGD